MGSKPSSASQTSSTYRPPASVLANYNQVTDQAKAAAATPYQAYSGQLVAGINGQQTTGINAVNSAAGIQDPYNQSATGLAGASAQTIDPTQFSAGQVGQYESPYQQDVINATMAQINNQNAQQSSALTGNAISAGAFGGDRAGVAQAALAGQQAIASNQTLASLENQNYSQALSEFNNQQTTGLSAAQNNASRQLAASQQLGTLGSTAQTEALNEANAQTNAGTLQQTTQQAQDTANYNQYLQQQAYPFQTTGWLANIVEGIGSQSGGTTTGTSQTDTNGLNSVLGGALGLGSLLIPKARGGRIPHMAGGGGLGGAAVYPGVFDPTAAGGQAGLGGGSFVPSPSLQVGHTMPQSGGMSTAAAPTVAQNANSIAQTAKGIQGLGNGLLNNSVGDQLNDAWQDFTESGLARGGRTGLAAARYANGGHVLGDGGLMRRPRFDDGGTVSPDALVFDPNALGVASAAPSASVPAGVAPTLAPDPAQSEADIKQQQVGRLMDGLSGKTPADTPESLPAFASGNVPELRTDSTSGLAPASSSTGVGLVPASAPASSGLAPAVAAAPAQDTSQPATGVVAADPSSLPRGLRNNNPGNLVDNSWTQGLPGYAGSDGRFAVFASPDAGNAALDRNLQSYGAKGVDTPLQISSKWAPAGDGSNDPVRYAGVIASTLGVGLNDPLDMSDPAVRAKVASAITKAENGGGLGGASSPSTALAYDDQPPGSLPGGLGAIERALSGQHISPSETTSSGGLLGLHLSDNARLGLLSAGLGMMASPSMSVGQAIGQGGLQGIQTYMNAAKQQAQIANYGAEVRSRDAQSRNLNSETQYRPAEVAIRQQNANTETARTQGQRYTLIPGPNGGFDYLDNFNPGRGILTSDQIANGASIVPSAAPHPTPDVPGSSVGTPGGAPTLGAVPTAPSSAQPNPAHPGANPPVLDSSKFMTTGTPSLSAPDGFLPVNYYVGQLRAQRDPIYRAAMEKQTSNDVDGANTRAQKAQNSIFYSDEMDRNAASLPNSGVLAPGALFPERLGLAKNWNLAVSNLGMDGLQVNPDGIRAGEALIKDKTRLGAQLTQALGSREAASVFSSMMSAVPGGDNTRAGYKAISSSLRALGQREIDHSAFMQDYVAKYGNTSGAEAAFNTLNPPMQYARQAESLAKIPQASIEMLRAHANDPRATARFNQTYGPGLARYYTGSPQ